MAKKQTMDISKLLMTGSLVAVALAAVGYFGFDFWLASTQWLLVAAVMAMFGVYTKLS